MKTGGGGKAQKDDCQEGPLGLFGPITIETAVVPLF